MSGHGISALFAQLKRIRIAISFNTRITVTDDSPSEGLHYLERLLCEGGSISPKYHDTAQYLLRRAVTLPDLPMVRLLVKLGVPVRERDKEGHEALHDAAQQMIAGTLGHSFHARPEIMRALLDAGAELNSRDKYGDTPLSLAVGCGLASSVRFLLGAGADPMAYGQNGDPTPQYLIDFFSCAREADAVATLLDVSEDVNSPDENGFRLLDRAAWLGCPTAVKELLRAGADPNLPSEYNGTRAIHFAAELMYHPDGGEAVTALIRTGADLDARIHSGTTPLMYAAARGSSAAVLALLEAGANPSLLNSSDRSPLHFAAQLMSDPSGHEALNALIRAAPATLNLADANKISPLQYAFMYGPSPAVRLLVNAGAQHDSRTPFDNDFAVELAAEMMQHRDGIVSISTMLDMGYNTSRPNKAGVTLRRFALSTNSLPLIKTVLERESD
ncbi:hypothetical protein BOTBODRAFT_188060, partial [Botryobasidium botryosum FD-172 SS1]